MERRKRRAFTKAYKAEVVELVRKSGKSIGAVAQELDLTETAVRAWVRQAEVDEGRGPAGALTTEEREELIRLRRENQTLRMEKEILKKATVGSMDRCNIFCFSPRLGDDAHGTNRTAWALPFAEAGTLAAMEEWAVAQ
jgi:transposase